MRGVDMKLQLANARAISVPLKQPTSGKSSRFGSAATSYFALQYWARHTTLTYLGDVATWGRGKRAPAWRSARGSEARRNVSDAESTGDFPAFLPSARVGAASVIDCRA